MPAVHDVAVSDATQLAPGVFLLGFHAPALVDVTRPGQFVMAIPPGGERCATALGIYEAQGERASILFFVCGPRTRELAELRVGDRFAVSAPLGNGFTFGSESDVAIVAGGVGIASVLLPAQALVRMGKRVRLFYGARTAQLLVEKDRFGASHLYSLAEFKGVRKGAPFEAEYLRGRYGAIPYLREFHDLFETDAEEPSEEAIGAVG